MRADLHLHTRCSDGAQTPADMVRRARAAGMDVIAITDHDAVAGVNEAEKAGRDEGILVLPGVELSVGLGCEIHMLGYGVNPDDEETRAFFAHEIEMRRERTLAMIEKLAARGIVISPEEATGDDGFMGRMALGEALCRHGWAESVHDAFARYIGDHAPCFVPRRRLSTEDGIRALRRMHALPVIAHPGRSGLSPERLKERLPEWMDAGLAGIEAWHASHSLDEGERFEALARANGLLVTGGSDCHGRPSDGRQPDGSRGGHAGIGEDLDGWKHVREDVEALCARMKEQKD